MRTDQLLSPETHAWRIKLFELKGKINPKALLPLSALVLDSPEKLLVLIEFWLSHEQGAVSGALNILHYFNIFNLPEPDIISAFSLILKRAVENPIVEEMALAERGSLAQSSPKEIDKAKALVLTKMTELYELAKTHAIQDVSCTNFKRGERYFSRNLLGDEFENPQNGDAQKCFELLTLDQLQTLAGQFQSINFSVLSKQFKNLVELFGSNLITKINVTKQTAGQFIQLFNKLIMSGVFTHQELFDYLSELSKETFDFLFEAMVDLYKECANLKKYISLIRDDSSNFYVYLLPGIADHIPDRDVKYINELNLRCLTFPPDHSLFKGQRKLEILCSLYIFLRKHNFNYDQKSWIEKIVHEILSVANHMANSNSWLDPGLLEQIKQCHLEVALEEKLDGFLVGLTHATSFGFGKLYDEWRLHEAFRKIVKMIHPKIRYGTYPFTTHELAAFYLEYCNHQTEKKIDTATGTKFIRENWSLIVAENYAHLTHGETDGYFRKALTAAYAITRNDVFRQTILENIVFEISKEKTDKMWWYNDSFNDTHKVASQLILRNNVEGLRHLLLILKKENYVIRGDDETLKAALAYNCTDTLSCILNLKKSDIQFQEGALESILLTALEERKFNLAKDAIASLEEHSVAKDSLQKFLENALKNEKTEAIVYLILSNLITVQDMYISHSFVYSYSITKIVNAILPERLTQVTHEFLKIPNIYHLFFLIGGLSPSHKNLIINQIPPEHWQKIITKRVDLTCRGLSLLAPGKKHDSFYEALFPSENEWPTSIKSAEQFNSLLEKLSPIERIIVFNSIPLTYLLKLATDGDKLGRILRFLTEEQRTLLFKKIPKEFWQKCFEEGLSFGYGFLTDIQKHAVFNSIDMDVWLEKTPIDTLSISLLNDLHKLNVELVVDAILEKRLTEFLSNIRYLSDLLKHCTIVQLDRIYNAVPISQWSEILTNFNILSDVIVYFTEIQQKTIINAIPVTNWFLTHDNIAANFNRLSKWQCKLIINVMPHEHWKEIFSDGECFIKILNGLPESLFKQLMRAIPREDLILILKDIEDLKLLFYNLKIVRAESVFNRLLEKDWIKLIKNPLKLGGLLQSFSTEFSKTFISWIPPASWIDILPNGAALDSLLTKISFGKCDMVFNAIPPNNFPQMFADALQFKVGLRCLSQEQRNLIFSTIKIENWANIITSASKLGACCYFTREQQNIIFSTFPNEFWFSILDPRLSIYESEPEMFRNLKQFLNSKLVNLAAHQCRASTGRSSHFFSTHSVKYLLATIEKYKNSPDTVTLAELIKCYKAHVSDLPTEATYNSRMTVPFEIQKNIIVTAYQEIYGNSYIQLHKDRGQWLINTIQSADNLVTILACLRDQKALCDEGKLPAESTQSELTSNNRFSKTPPSTRWHLFSKMRYDRVLTTIEYYQAICGALTLAESFEVPTCDSRQPAGMNTPTLLRQ